MEVDIRFFQAAATAIPTLLIALAFTAKAFHPDDENDSMWSPRSLFDMIVISVLFAMIAGAEMVSLAVLITNKTNFLEAALVGVVVGIELVMLWGAAISASIDKFRPKLKRYQNAMVVFSLVMVLAPFAAFFSVLLRD